MAGFLGISLGLFVYISVLCSLRSFGVPLTKPYAPSSDSEGNGYFLPPIWKREYRPPYINAKREKNQNKISMNWKYGKQ